MSIASFAVLDTSNTYQDGSANSTANNDGWVCINGSTLRIMTQRTPSSSTSDALAGEWCYDSSYVYIAVGTNSWKRVGLSSF